jgi:nucleotide-binding universal stress UspA family protein
MKTILVATDGSMCAERATAEAIELARATGWPLHVVTAWSVPTQIGYEPAPVVSEIMETQREHAASVAQETAQRARSFGVRATEEVREGIAAEEICAAARELPAGLVVVGAHGWGPVKRILIGSVSTHVLHDAPCPVLVVRARETPAEEGKRLHAAAAGR